MAGGGARGRGRGGAGARAGAGAAGRAGAAPPPPAAALEVWRRADAVCFDVDSTVCRDEGIDELAEYLGKRTEVAEWTARAMDGGVPFQEALAARLEIIQPSQAALDQFLAFDPPNLSPRVAELVGVLRGAGREVFLVSGGFRQMIAPVAAAVGVKPENVFANSILFDEAGLYAGFDAEEFTSRAGGKAEAIRYLKARDGFQTLVMVGDGATDMEARQDGGADLFVGFGGVVARPAIVAGADWFVESFDPLIEGLA